MKPENDFKVSYKLLVFQECIFLFLDKSTSSYAEFKSKIFDSKHARHCLAVFVVFNGLLKYFTGQYILGGKSAWWLILKLTTLKQCRVIIVHFCALQFFLNTNRLLAQKASGIIHVDSGSILIVTLKYPIWTKESSTWWMWNFCMRLVGKFYFLIVTIALSHFSGF